MDAFVVTGREAILARAGQLEELALRCGQLGAMHGLRLLLGTRYAVRKRPHLICFHEGPVSGSAHAGPLQAAVLLLEYCAAGLATGLLATADSFGVRTVVAPASQRVDIAFAAVEAMLKRGARVVLVSFKQEPLPVQLISPAGIPRPFLFAMQRRTVQDTLVLRDSVEATLATLGRRTRVHLRAARRRFENTVPTALFADASSALAAFTAQDLRQVNDTCLDTIDQRDFDHQVRSVSGPNSFVLGLRDGERWLALVAGWRQGTATWVEWQLNAAGYEKLSLGSVLRSYLLEHEIGLGMRQFSFHGGTSHSMAHSFVKEEVVDLLGRRPCMLNSAIVLVARQLSTRFPRLRRRGNFLLDALADNGLTWSSEPDHPSTL